MYTQFSVFAIQKISTYSQKEINFNKTNKRQILNKPVRPSDANATGTQLFIKLVSHLCDVLLAFRVLFFRYYIQFRYFDENETNITRNRLLN